MATRLKRRLAAWCAMRTLKYNARLSTWCAYHAGFFRNYYED